MNKETGTITPTEYEGVGVVSFGFAGQGSAIMRGPMVSGLINQMLTTTDWGELDYLIIDMPPGTGDVQLTICQVVPITAAVVVTTPQKLAFIDVEKGVRMFSKLRVPCVAVVENMSYFEVGRREAQAVRRGQRPAICDEYGVPNLFQMPIVPELSACGDSGKPLVLADPRGRFRRSTASDRRESRAGGGEASAGPKGGSDDVRRRGRDGDHGVRRCACSSRTRAACRSTSARRTCGRAIRAPRAPGEPRKAEFHRWTASRPIPDDIAPSETNVVGNYAVQISWPDGFSQVATFAQIAALERLEVKGAGKRAEETAAAARS